MGKGDDAPSVDLGHGVSYRKFQWKPDRDIPENAERYKDIPDVEWAGITVVFPGGCEGSVMFDIPALKKLDFSNTDYWTVESYDPLTISPSIQCRKHPEHHGFIKEGKWIPS